jgi:hypothetical protein
LEGDERLLFIHHTYSIGELFEPCKLYLFRPKTEVFYTSTPS